jgi:hypothetical protein
LALELLSVAFEMKWHTLKRNDIFAIISIKILIMALSMKIIKKIKLFYGMSLIGQEIMYKCIYFNDILDEFDIS